jgi:hypothetical protein
MENDVYIVFRQVLERARVFLEEAVCDNVAASRYIDKDVPEPEKVIRKAALAVKVVIHSDINNCA